MNSRDAGSSSRATSNAQQAGVNPAAPALPAACQSLRAWLAHLAATERVATIAGAVALEHQLAAIAKRLDGRQASFFLQPGGHDIPVVSGFMSRRAWIAEALGVPESELLSRFQAAMAQPLPAQLVAAGQAPCQEVVHARDIGLRDLRRLLPIPTHSEHDNGPYITAGLVIARNPRTGVQNVSINRIQVHRPDRMAILLLPRHLNAFFQTAEQAGDALSVAVVIGVDPLTMLASQAIAPIDNDELEIAGALRGAPLPVVKCITSDVHVPADAEIVIEGRILPHERDAEGPFGEFPKYYSAREAREVIQVDALTHRAKPIYHTIVPAEMEHLLLGAIPREATLLDHLQRSHPNVKDVHLSVGGVCRYHLWIKLEKTREGEAKNVILCAFGAHYDIKQVVVVDTDVEIHDPNEVEWAVATRFQADRDLVVISGAQGSVLDPSTTVDAGSRGMPPHLQGISSKMGLDATRPLVYHEHVFTRVRIPGEDQVDLATLASLDPAPLEAYLAQGHEQNKTT